MLFKEIIAVYSENHKKLINAIYKQNVGLKAKAVPLQATEALVGRGGITPTYS
jgi:hypothetical protein